MSGHFKLTSLLGRAYTDGNVVFTPDGSTLISPVGNRIVMMDVQRFVTLSGVLAQLDIGVCYVQS